MGEESWLNTAHIQSFHPHYSLASFPRSSVDLRCIYMGMDGKRRGTNITELVDGIHILSSIIVSLRGLHFHNGFFLACQPFMHSCALAMHRRIHKIRNREMISVQ